MAPACSRPKEGKNGGKPKMSKAEKTKDTKDEVKEEDGSGRSLPSMKDLLEEANKVLKSLNSSPSSSTTSPTAAEGDERQEVVERLQRQLNSLKQKAFRLMRMKQGGQTGLLDSGATHPLRPAKQGENVALYDKVEVALADGQTTWLPISPGGCMITEDQGIEPILPMGFITKELGCSVRWTQGHLEVEHPARGLLAVEEKDGCPQIARKEALELIDRNNVQES